MLEAVPGEGVARVTATSLARVVVVLREIGEDDPGRRLTKVIAALRDRDLLQQTQETLAGSPDFVEYDEGDLERLLR
ncbi:hypothetical protein ABT120_28380 [Nonomuraea angiospora]|uniref:hypothetical protein n=1 Tax=Nonomuraea angiospora TaxID=46172 RepID=UPI003329A4F5